MNDTQNSPPKIMRLSHWNRVYDSDGDLVSETAHAWGDVCEAVDGDAFVALDHHETVVAERDALRIALADAILRPMGVIPASAVGLIATAELEAAEQRRPRDGRP